MIRTVARRGVLGAAASVALTLVPATPSAAEEANVQLHTAAFRGAARVQDVDGITPEVEVRAGIGACDAVVAFGTSVRAVPCSFEFVAPLARQAYCTGTATGAAILRVELPSGHSHEFTYTTRVLADETTVHGFGTAHIDVLSIDVRTGWVKFDAVTSGCNRAGPNIGVAQY